MSQCAAMSKQSGVQCKRPAMPGLTVCHIHGGGTRAAKAKSRRVVAESKASALMASFGLPVPVDPVAALDNVLAEGNGEWIAYANGLVALIESGAGLEDERVQAMLAMRGKARQVVAQVAKVCIDASVEQRRVRLEESQVALMGSVLRLSALELGMDLGDDRVRRVVAGQLRALESGTVVDVEEVD